MIKLGFLTLFLSYMYQVQARPTQICEEGDDETSNLANSVCIFSEPLLVGASLTQGYKANPGGSASIIAETLSPGAKITNIAKGGARSSESLKDHTLPTDLPSIVIGIDLFFWDAARNECDENFEASTKNFIKMYQDKNIPMILGRLPKGVSNPPGYNILNLSLCTDKINKLLENECTIDKNCLIYDPKDCLSKIDPKDGVIYFVDKLHTSIEANKFCANDFIASGKYNDLRCKKD